MNDAQTKIVKYLRPAGPISDFTYRCFVGMMETGEALYDDFKRAGGEELAIKVKALKDGEVYSRPVA